MFMKTTIDKAIGRILLISIFLFTFSSNFAQQTEDLSLPLINLVPKGLSKSNFQLCSSKSEILKIESEKLMTEKKLLEQRCLGKLQDSPEGKKCQSDLAILTKKLNELSPKINNFNTEIEEIVYKDPALDKLSVITYYTLKKDQKSWDEFQKNIVDEKIILKQDKVKVQRELAKVNTKKQKTKTLFNEGVVLSMYSEEDLNKSLKDSLISPFTGVTYKEMNANRQKNMTDSGVVIVSFVMQKNENTSKEAGGKKETPVPSETFSLASPKTKTELSKLKDKRFNRLIAHSNGATLVESLVNDSLIEVKELNIIGGEKSLINGLALQQLLDNGSVKRIVVWVKLDDPAIWITPLNDHDISERTQNFISYKTKYDKKGIKTEKSKVEYKWILDNGSLALLNARDPQFISTYFREISRDLRAK